MKKIIVLLAMVASVACVAADGVRTETKQPRKSLKVLMIGNSFSICLLQQFPQVAKAMDVQLDLCSMFIGGCSFERHWQNVEKAGDPDFLPYGIGWNYTSCDNAAAPIVKAIRKVDRTDRKTGKAHKQSGSNIPQMLVADRWDIVTIQQASHFSWQPDSYHPYADNLVNKIRELAPQAEIVVQETWSYTPWDGRFKKWGIDQNEMYAKLHAAYGDFAKANGFMVIPVGTAVQLYRKALPVVYTENSFGGDPCGSAKFEQQPNGKWKPKGDVFHFNREGHYLQALVWAASLYGVDVTKCPYKPDFLDAARAEKMKACAMKAVKGK